MKHIFEFTVEDYLKFKTTVDYLIDSMVSFKACYKIDGSSTIEFECDDEFYKFMEEEVPRIYNESY
jgi:hypothetical protein